jgi:hypothetical protein
VQPGFAAVDITDFEFPEWHTERDNLDAVSARSLQVVGDVVLESLPQIEMRFAGPAKAGPTTEGRAAFRRPSATGCAGI